jgi:hypothetical protein
MNTMTHRLKQTQPRLQQPTCAFVPICRSFTFQSPADL